MVGIVRVFQKLYVRISISASTKDTTSCLIVNFYPASDCGALTFWKWSPPRTGRLIEGLKCVLLKNLSLH